ncbi:hypothetical protein [Mitsuokella jalaludinii]|uniref:hypothetical protein n=2 Tax=Mitsuokella jalaludinii TaxID=187979 RepID=UPI003077D8AB
MKIHYFQRYHQGEDVATANTMLLLSRLYHYSSDKFYLFLKSICVPNSTWDFNPGLSFNLQESAPKSRLDAVIVQQSFKVAVETKLSDWFYEDQIQRHLDVFGEEQYKVLMTLAPVHMANDKMQAIARAIAKHKEDKGYDLPIIHVNITFEEIAAACHNVLDDRDYEMLDIVEDYLDYCYHDGLIAGADSWKFMRMQLAGATFDFNMKQGVYYDGAKRGFRPHDYLGLYKNKSVRAVGKIVAMIVADASNPNDVKYTVEKGDLTNERKTKIALAIKDAKQYGYNLRKVPQRYFFVDTFYETDFQKETRYPPRGSRIFDLTEVLGTQNIPAAPLLAALLRKKTWK